MKKKELKQVCATIGFLWDYIGSKVIVDPTIKINIQPLSPSSVIPVAEFRYIPPVTPLCSWVISFLGIRKEFCDQVIMPEVNKYGDQLKTLLENVFKGSYIASDLQWDCYVRASDEVESPSENFGVHLTWNCPFDFMKVLISDSSVQELLDFLPKPITREIFKAAIEHRVLFTGGTGEIFPKHEEPVTK